jgi:hypothetical protein
MSGMIELGKINPSLNMDAYKIGFNALPGLRGAAITSTSASISLFLASLILPT